MEKILFSLNANFAAQLLNGFAGVIPIFVNPAIKDNAMEIMWVNTRKINCQFAQARANAQ